MRGGATAALLAASLALGACSAPGPERKPPVRVVVGGDAPAGGADRAGSATPDIDLWSAHRAAVMALDSWDARGKVAYRLPGESGSASLLWRQRGERSEVRLSGPLGAGSTVLRNDGALIRVRRDGIERRYPADAAPWLPDGQLLPVPVNSLRYWVRGVPDPVAGEAEVLSDGGLAVRLAQAGWVIHIESYDGASPPLPSRLRIEAPSADLELRMLIREWDRSDRAHAAPGPSRHAILMTCPHSVTLRCPHRPS